KRLKFSEIVIISNVRKRLRHDPQFHSRAQQQNCAGRLRNSPGLRRAKQVEPASLRRLSRPDRSLQTTLPAQTSGAVSTEQSAAARLRFWLSLELQGRQFDRGGSKMTSLDMKETRTLITKTCETKNTENRLLGNRSANAMDSFRDVAAQGS